MKYGAIKTNDIANGPGIRVSLFVSGCDRHCAGCHNSELWDREYGEEFTLETENEILGALSKPYIEGITILGGEPMLHEQDILHLLMDIRYVFEYVPKNVWLYTGYKYEDIEESELLNYVDVLVDGEFIQEQRNIALQFRGSENQRLIDVKKTKESGEVVIWDEAINMKLHDWKLGDNNGGRIE